MAHIYNSQLDAFDLYHQAQESRPQSFFSPNGTVLPALGHGLAGSAGAAISNVATYPLDLVITRLQIQKQLRKDLSSPSENEYNGLQDAARKIYQNEGGLAGFYTGVLQDTGKTIADSFLFFLAYNLLREKRIAVRDGKRLSAIDELGVGFLAGSFTKFLTSPLANIVTRKQAAAFTAASPESHGDGKGSAQSKVPSSSQIVRDIWREKGPLGFWAGYSASLVLTLNPSLTFFLFETLKRLLLPRSRRENPPASATFFLAAISKVCATSVTYPFSLAKARAQAGTRPEKNDEKESVGDSGELKRAAVQSTIFGTLLTIARTEGVRGMYEGLELEVIKSFFSHGFTMLVKQAIHRFIVQAYYVLSILISRYKRKADPVKLAERAKQQSVEYYDLAIARASEKIQDARAAVMAAANETAEFVAEYVEEEDEGEWRNLYGTGLARWLVEK